MEILDPRTKSVTFLTMHHMVKSKDRRERALCELKKNEAFMTSENLWIAAESFKLSLSPNPDGLVYTTVPPTYYVRIEIDDEKDEKTQDTLLDYVNIIACNSLADEPSITMQPSPFLASGAIAGLLQPVSVDYRTIMRGLAQQMNNFCITKGEKLHVVMKQPAAQGQAQPDIANDVILIENPLDRFCGFGYGKNGLETIECYSPTDNGVIPWPPLQPARQGNGMPQPGVWYLRITKADHPGLTAEHVRSYFSFGQYVYCQTMVDATNPVSINNTCQYWFDVWGPTIIQTDNVALTAPNAQAGNVYQPVVKLYTKHGQPFRVGNKVYGEVVDVNDPAETIEVSANVTVLDERWVLEDADYYHVSIQCDAQNMGPSGVAVAGSNWQNCPTGPNWMGNNGPAIYFAYFWGAGTAMGHISAYVRTKLDLAPGQQAHFGVDKTNRLTTVWEQRVEGHRNVWVKQAHPVNTVPAYTPNHFFEMFNTGFGTEKPPYTLGTDPNGGFRLTVLRDDINMLSISKIMCDDLGLMPVMNFDGVTFSKPNVQEYNATMIPVDRNFKPKQEFSGDADFHNMVVESAIESFSIYDVGQGVTTGPLRADSAQLSIIKSETTGEFFQFLNVQPLLVQESTISQGTLQPAVEIDAKGEYVYRYRNPPIGGYITNTANVSIGGFSLFSDIRIVVPVGIIFNPQLSGRSDSRILAEMRLPFVNTSSVIQGMGPEASPEGLLMSTTSSFFGDILWNSISSKQYLKVTSQNPIYEIRVEVRLVYRDQSIEPKVLMLGYNDIFDMKIRLLQTQ